MSNLLKMVWTEQSNLFNCPCYDYWYTPVMHEAPVEEAFSCKGGESYL